MLRLLNLSFCVSFIIIVNSIYIRAGPKEKKDDNGKETSSKKVVLRTYSKENPTISLDHEWRLKDYDVFQDSPDANDLGISLDISMDALGSSLFEDQLGQSLDTSDMNLGERLKTSAMSFTTSTPQKDKNDENELDIFSFVESPMTPISRETGISLKPRGLILRRLSSEYQNSSKCNVSSSDIDPSNITSDISGHSFTQYDIDHLQHIEGIVPRKDVRKTPVVDIDATKKKLNKHGSISRIVKMLKEECCTKRCLALFQSGEIKSMRLKYWSKKPRERHQWIFDKFLEQKTLNKDTSFILERGLSVCQIAFMRIYDISKSVFYLKRKKFLKGAISSSCSKFRQRTTKFLTAMNWFENYVSYHGDRMPDCKIVFLPYRTRKFVIFKQYRNEISSAEALKRSTFYRMWSASFPYIKIKEVNSFSKCTKCASLERRLEKTSNPLKREKIIKLRQDHNRRQMEERKYYYSKRDMAKTSPSKYLSLIIDGMDQSKTNLPHFVGRTAKAVNPGDQLTTHISGIIAHGQRMLYTFLDWCQYPHDSNLTINLLLGIIYKISHLNKNVLPPILFVQADNCWRENKNKYVLAFFEMLVHLKVFQEVHLSFLYVGHTHEDIDAGFSRIADSLRRNDAETIPDLLNLMPNPSDIVWLYNARDWMLPFINDVRHHTKPLHYKFSMDTVTNKVSVSYKSNHASSWKHTGVSMFNHDDNGKVILPTGCPKVLSPTLEKIQLDKMKARLADWKCLFSDQIEQKQYQWWKDYIEYIQRLKSDEEFVKSEITDKAVWYLTKLPKLHQVTPDDTDDPNPTEDLENMVNDELEEHEIQIIQKRKKQPLPSQSVTQTMQITQKKSKGPSSVRKKKRRIHVTRIRTIYCSFVGILVKTNKHYVLEIVLELLSSLFMFLFLFMLMLNEYIFTCINIHIIWKTILAMITENIAQYNIIEALLGHFILCFNYFNTVSFTGYYLCNDVLKM